MNGTERNALNCDCLLSQGPQGPQGEQGPQGPLGVPGERGPKGDTGNDGKSAYQLAVEGGYTGTEEEFKEELARLPYQAQEAVSAHNLSLESHADIRQALETLQLLKLVDILPAQGESKYIYAVPQDERTTDDQLIVVLFIWTGTEFAAVGALTTSVDLSEYLKKTDAQNTYLPKTGGYIVGSLSIAREKGLIDTLMPESGSGSGYTRLRVYSYNGHWVGYLFHNATGDASIMLVDGGHLDIGVTNDKEVRIRGERILTIGDKGVSGGVASLGTDGKVPQEQLPDNIGGGAPTLKWYKNNTGSTVTIDDTSSASLVKVYKNGVLLEPEEDYSIDGTTLTLTTALIATDKITTEVF